MSYNLSQLHKDLNKKSKQQLIMVGTSWGSNAWNFMYNIALAGNGTKTEIHNFLRSIGPILPCKECIEHYDAFLNSNNLPDTHADMFQWLLNLENDIAKNKYGKNYKYINRYRQIQKISLIKYSLKNDEIITSDVECKKCYQKKKHVKRRTKQIRFG